MAISKNRLRGLYEGESTTKTIIVKPTSSGSTQMLTLAAKSDPVISDGDGTVESDNSLVAAANAWYEGIVSTAYDGIKQDFDEYYDPTNGMQLFESLGQKTDLWDWIESCENKKYLIDDEVKTVIKPGTFPQFKRVYISEPRGGWGTQMCDALKFWEESNKVNYPDERVDAISITASDEKLTIEFQKYDFDKTCQQLVNGRLLDSTYSAFRAATILVAWAFGNTYDQDTTKKISSCVCLSSLKKYDLERKDFSDGVIPERIFLAMQAGGGAGATGFTFAGPDGNGGGGGAFSLLSIRLEKNKIYRVFVGSGGAGIDSAGRAGGSGEPAFLEKAHDRIYVVNGGCGGTCDDGGAGGTADESSSCDDVRVMWRASGGKGSDGSGKGNGENIAETWISSYEKNATSGDVSVNLLHIPGGKSPESLAQTFTGSGGASAFGDGGQGGKDGFGGYGLPGYQGGGGGGGRYLHWGHNKGGNGGDGFAMIFC